jgi:hypothetical protein
MSRSTRGRAGRMCSRVNAVEQPRFRRMERRRLPRSNDVAVPTHRAGRIDRHDLAGDKPVEKMADRGEPLLDARRGELPCAGLDHTRRALCPRRG